MGKQIQSQEPVLEETEELEGTTDEPKESESAEESVRAALAEIEAEQSTGGEGQEKEDPDSGSDSESVPKIVPENIAAKPKEIKKGKEKELEEDFDPDAHPPERFKPHEKAWFNKIPQKGLKQAIHRSIKELEGAMTRATQAAAEKEKEAGSLIEAIKPYTDQFTERNISAAQGIAALCLAQKKLTDTSNPKLQRETWLAIGRDIGMDVSQFEGNGGSQHGDMPDISTHPVIKQLIDENKRLQSLVEPVHNQLKETADRNYQQQFQTVLQELEAVQHETDAAGNYKFPELHDAAFLESWKPLVSAIVRNEKRSYGEAARLAYQRITGKSSGLSNQAKIPAGNNSNNRAVSAAVSVRGKSAPRFSQTVEEDEAILPNETPEQSIRAALRQIARG